MHMKFIGWEAESLTEDIKKKNAELLSHLESVIDDLSRMKKHIESGDDRCNCYCGNSINELLQVSQLASEISGEKKALAVCQMALESE